MDGPRHPTLDEFPSLSRLLDQTFRAKELESGEHDVMLGQYPHLVNTDNLEHLWIFVDGGRVAAHLGTLCRPALIEGHRVGMSMVGAVATAPEYRGRQLASRLLDAAMQQAVAEGNPLMPISGGRGLYTRLGATPCFKALKYRITREAARKFADSRLIVREAASADLPLLQALYRSEPLRYQRLPVDFERALDTKFALNRPVSFKLIQREGAPNPCAYFLAQTNVNAEGIAWVCEAAGDKHAALGALAGLFAEEDFVREKGQSYDFPVLPQDLDTQALLERAGAPRLPQYSGETVLACDVARLLRDLEGYQMERLGARRRLSARVSGEVATFSVAGEPWTCPLVDVSRVLFGDPATAPRPPAGPVADALAKLAPIVLPPYGLNYV